MRVSITLWNEDSTQMLEQTNYQGVQSVSVNKRGSLIIYFADERPIKVIQKQENQTTDIF